MLSKPPPAPASPLRSLLSAEVFPGRRTVTCSEVAKVLSLGEQHIRNLCDDGTILGAVNVAGSLNAKRKAYWRIPVSAYDAWLKRQSNVEACVPFRSK